MADTGNYDRRSRAQWRALVVGYEASGLSQRAFCERRGVALSTFRHWREQLAQDPGDVHTAALPAVRLVPVQLVAEPAVPAGSGIALLAGGGVRIELAAGFDAVTLQRVLATLVGRA